MTDGGEEERDPREQGDAQAAKKCLLVESIASTTTEETAGT
jgi:hypothetical protein